MNINTNISALSAQNSVSAASRDMAVNMERLSTGKRINSAADDAAGLQISERFNAQLSGLKMAERNANDGISVVETAEGALNNVSDMLQRMRELSVQSSNAALNDSDRASLGQELDQLMDEINSVGERAQFNGTKLLDGTYTDKVFQIGSNQGDTMNISMGSVKTDSLGGGNVASLSAQGSTSALLAGDLAINGVNIGPSLASDDHASDETTVGDAASSAIAKVAAINRASSETGVMATVNENEVVGAVMTAGGGTAVSETLTLNGVDITISTVEDDASATRTAVAASINQYSGQTGVTAVDTGSDSKGVTLVAEDGRNITLLAGDAALTAALTGLTLNGTTETTHSGGYTLTSASEITVTRGSTGTLAGLDNSGLQEGTFSSQQASVSSISAGAVTGDGTVGNGTAWASGDLVINGTLIRETNAIDDSLSSSNKNESAVAKAAAINASSDQTGVTATVNANLLDGTDQTAAALTGTISINGISTATISTTADAAQSRETVVAAINAISDRTGVTAVDTGVDSADGGVQLVAEDGRNITLAHTTLTAAATGLAADGTYAGSFTLQSAGPIEITSQNATNFAANEDFAAVGTFGAGKTGQALNTININSSDSALKAITAIDNALDQVSEMRSDLGAKQNRLDYTITNLQSTHENMSAAQSRIEDADFATESTELAKMKILQQAGMAMLAQANQSGQQVLSLLR